MQKRLGIIGGGQLGKMIAIAAANLGIQSSFIDPSGSAVAASVARQIKADFDDKAAIEQLFNDSDAVTFEFENVSVEAIKALGDLDKLSPNLEALFVANDRIREKEFFRSCGQKVAEFEALTDCKNLNEQDFLQKAEEAIRRLGAPVIIKTCSLGYDGKGQVSVKSDNLDETIKKQIIEIKNSDRLIVEKKVNFSREFSVVAVRSKEGEVRVYPVPTNVHKEGILFSSVVVKQQTDLKLQSAVEAIMHKLKYVGVLAIEFFEADGSYLVNEMAPRVHNTGHWTIEGAVTSQFENHVRAVMGLPLGDTSLRFPVAMLNIIGHEPDADKVLSIPGAHLHIYGKEPRAKRKLGHITIEAADERQLMERVGLAAQFL